MFKLKTLKLTNFLAIQSATIDLHKPGLYLITGYNQRGGDSNGAGKSTILGAIAFALWGKTPEGLKASDVANWYGDGTFLAELTLEGPEGDYVITRETGGLSFSINGKNLIGRKGDVQELINDTFNSSYDIFFASTLFTSNMSDYITNMGDADKKKLFKSVIGLEAIDKAYIKAKAAYDTNHDKAINLEQQLALLTDFRDARRGELEQLYSQFDRFERSRQNRMDDANRTTIIKPELDPIIIFRAKTVESSLAKLNAKLPEIAETQVKLDQELRKAYEDRGAIVQEITIFEEKLYEANSLKGDASCDKCGGLLGDNYVSHLSHLHKDIERVKNREFNINQDISKLESERQDVELWHSSIDKLEEEAEELRLMLRYHDEEMQKWSDGQQTKEQEMKKIKNEENPYEELIRITSDDLNKQASKYLTANDEFKKATEAIDILAFLKLVFSREGVAAQIIEQSFGRLQALANRYLSKLCSEGMLLTITPQRELKSKALKEEIDIYITFKHLQDKKVPFAALSGGQKQRVNIALLMALYKLCKELGCNNFDFIILDEVLDLSLASKGQADVVRLIRDLLQEVSQVLVVSHQEGISQDFDYEISVRLDDKGISHVV